MKTKMLAALLTLCSTGAMAGPEPGPNPNYPPNLALDFDAPGAVRAEIVIESSGLKEPLKYEFSAQGGFITGGVFATPGGSSYFSITAFDGRGEPVFRGEGKAEISKEYTREFTVPLTGGDEKDPFGVRFGTQVLDARLEPGYGDGYLVAATLLDALGNHVPMNIDDIKWELPPGFEVLPYSCFMDSLCIELPKPDITVYLCHIAGSCPKPKPDTRPKYRFVAVGKNHTCAITEANDLRCWGLNNAGQLGAPTGVCQVGGLPCSVQPVAVQCPANEVCKFRWVAAGGDHTCAADTNGKAWCWGEEGNPAAGKPSPTPNPTSPVHRQLPAFNRIGVRADFVAIDTNFDHSCGLSAAGDVYCWGHDEEAQLGFVPAQIPGPDKWTFNATLLQTGSTYKSIHVGHRHTCAMQITGLLDCWGSNAGRQVTFANLPFGSLVTVNSKVPMLNNAAVSQVATGFGDTCAQNASNNLICWGSPDQSLTFATAGFNALAGSFSRSIATEFEGCAGGTVMCNRTCAVSFQWGDLSCGRWVQNTRGTLTQVNDPKHYYHVSIYQQVDVGPNHICALNQLGDVLCFGLNTFGQFGTGFMSSVRTDEPDVEAIRLN